MSSKIRATSCFGGGDTDEQEKMCFLRVATHMPFTLSQSILPLSGSPRSPHYTSLSLCTPLFRALFMPLLCLAELIEYLNKQINHWHAAKTDRSREVMFIKLPRTTAPQTHSPTHFDSLIPTCRLFCWMCTSLLLQTLPSNPGATAKVTLEHGLIHYLGFLHKIYHPITQPYHLFPFLFI